MSRYLSSVAVLLLSLACAAAAQTPATVSSAVKLTEPQDDYPDVSPDGRSILFQSNRSGSWQLWRTGIDGVGLARLSNDGFNHRQPAWSPDGRMVAYSSDEGQKAGLRAIWLATIAAGGKLGVPRKLSSGAGQDVHPKWLPNGRGLIFNRISADGRQADVHVVDLDGRERRIELGRGLNTYASVDRSGSFLVYRGTTTEARSDGPFENSDIFVSAPDGTNKRRLTDDPAFDGWPAISPDGSTIAFASRRGGDKFRVYLIPANGGEPREVLAPPGYNYTQPAWSPDGRSLVVYRWNADSAGEAGHLVRVGTP